MTLPVPAEALTVFALLPAAGTGGTSLLYNVVPILLFFAIIYFIGLRPQQQQQKAHEAMLASLAKDDQVVTSGGIHGRVVEVGPEVIVMDIGDKTRVKVDRASIARKAGSPASDDKK